MNWFPLPIFPEGSLATSVVTTVWVGVVVFSLFNLRFGWVYSGLVVPGYLIPLFIDKPLVAVVVVCEAILTLWTTKLIMAALPRFGLACEFFGRDRFFAMILISAFYRLIFDVSILPALGQFLNETCGIAFDYQNTLHSFGLIVICLLANQLFKTGVVKGAIPFLSVMVVTYLIIRYGLMEFTNFSLTGLSFMYEDVAASVYAAPKAYIILITASIIASRLNLFYGWDFNGIMIPALLAIQWYEPMKILTTVVEALVILHASLWIMKFPLFNSMTIEGSRKVMFFFTVSFAYKMLIGWGMFLTVPEVKVSDFYGFGYLLPTLMAIKMQDLNKVVHQIRITIQVSLISVVAANLIGLALTMLPPVMGNSLNGPKLPVLEPIDVAGKSTETVFRDEVINLCRIDQEDFPKGNEIELTYHFSKALRELFNGGNKSEKLRFLMDQSRCRIGTTERGFYIIRPEISGRRGFMIVNPNSNSGLTIEIPWSDKGYGLTDAGISIFEDQDAGILFTASLRNGAAGGDPYQRVVESQFSPGGILRLRENRNTSILVNRKIPVGLSLKKLQIKAGGLETIWESCETLGIDQGLSVHGFAELNICPVEWGIRNGSTKPGDEDLSFQELIRKVSEPVAEPASEDYEIPSPGELRFIDENLLKPLFSRSSPQIKRELAHWQTVARKMNLELSLINHLLILRDGPESGRNWGGFALNLAGTAGDFALVYQIPSRSFDRSLVSFASNRFQLDDATLLLWSGSSSLANTNGSARLTALENRESFFHLVHQSFLVNHGEKPISVVQLRSLMPAEEVPYPSEDLVLSIDNRTISRVVAESRLTGIKNRWEDEGFSVALGDQTDDTAVLAVGANLQSAALAFSQGNVFAQLWIPPHLRRGFVTGDAYLNEIKRNRAVGVEIKNVDLFTEVEKTGFDYDDRGSLASLKKGIADYRMTNDIVTLEELVSSYIGKTEMWIDQASGQPNLVLLNRSGKIELLATLSGFTTGQTCDPREVNVNDWLAKRAGFLHLPPALK